MIAVACLVVVIALLGVMFRGSASGSLAPVERLYLVTTPLPVILALVLPGPLALIGESSVTARAWGLWLNGVGGWLSLALVLVGMGLAGRRWTHGQPGDRRILAGLMLAAIPALLFGLVGLLYLV